MFSDTDQDKGLDELSKVIQRQKMMGHAIGDEVDYQNGKHSTDFKASFTRDQIYPDPFGIGSTIVRIHSVYTGPVRYWNGIVPYGITFTSGPIWYQIANPICSAQ